MHKKALLARFQMVYLNASWIGTVEKLWPFEIFEHEKYENVYTIRANTLKTKTWDSKTLIYRALRTVNWPKREYLSELVWPSFREV